MGKRFTYCLALVSFLIGTVAAYAQQGDVHLHKGNKAYESNDFKTAADEYQKALGDKSAAIKGKFNLGDAYYRQGNYDKAVSAYNEALALTKDKILMAHAYHNIGNSLLQQKKYEESIKAYKNALYNNCKDEDTRYNLAYAEAKLDNKKKQQQQQQNQKQNQQKENKNKDKDKDKDKQNKDKQKEQQKDQQQQQQQDKLNKQDAQRMLDALNNDEKNTQDKLQKKKAVGTRQIEKNW